MKFNKKKPCKECPFMKASLPGYLGENDPLEFMRSAHREGGLACHMSINQQPPAPDQSDPDARDATNAFQCVGAVLHAIKSCKQYQNPDLAKMQQRLEASKPDMEAVLGYREFLSHHQAQQ